MIDLLRRVDRELAVIEKWCIGMAVIPVAVFALLLTACAPAPVPTPEPPTPTPTPERNGPYDPFIPVVIPTPTPTPVFAPTWGELQDCQTGAYRLTDTPARVEHCRRVTAAWDRVDAGSSASTTQATPTPGTGPIITLAPVATPTPTPEPSPTPEAGVGPDPLAAYIECMTPHLVMAHPHYGAEPGELGVRWVLQAEVRTSRTSSWVLAAPASGLYYEARPGVTHVTEALGDRLRSEIRGAALAAAREECHGDPESL